jgi:predicted permease
MRNIAQDFRYALRILRGHPGTTAVAVLSLALGIGANTAIYSVIDALLLRPLPYEQPDQIVQVYSSVPAKGYNRMSLSLPDVSDIGASGTFRQVAPFSYAAVNLTGEGDARRVVAISAGDGFFGVLGVGAELGRTLRPGEAGATAPRVMVLSYGFWQRQFGGDASVIGRTVEIDGEAREIVGVMPKGFDFPSARVEVWMPLVESERQTARGSRAFRAIARLPEDGTLAAAVTRLDGIAKQLSDEYPTSNQGLAFAALPLKDALYGKEFRTVSMILMVAVLAVLLVACANVANLLLARSAARAREAALRSALGASRGRLLRQYLLESLVLAGVGGIAGILLGLWGIDGLLSIMPAEIPRISTVGMNGSVFGFALVLSGLSGVIFGLAPALKSAGASASEVLKDGGRGQHGGRRSGRLRSGLVIGELAVALLLVMCAGLMLRSFAAMRQIEPGFATDHILTLGVSLPASRFNNDSLIESYSARAQLALAALPGVERVTAANLLPSGGNNNSSGFEIVGLPEPRPEDRPEANHRAVTPEYFSTFQVPIRSGRPLTAEDRFNGEHVAVVNEALVRRYFGSLDPIGQRLSIGRGEAFRVVGVVADFREREMDLDAWPTFFLPFGQWPTRDIQFAVRTTGDPAALGGAAREALRDLDPLVPVANTVTMEARIAEMRAGDWIMTRLLVLLGGLALVLAAAGVFGVMAYTVNLRSGEFGVRMAIGASQRDILRLVLREGLRLGAFGITIGLLLALAGTRVLARFLAGLSPLDPGTYIGVTLALFGAVLLASYLPALRATRADPMHTLRSE